MLKKESFVSRNFNFIFAILLFILLSVNVLPTLLLPPISDDWHLLYFFHHLDSFSGPVKWLHVLNYDPFEQMRYQPLSRIPYLLLHEFFGSNFLYFRLTNFLFYFLSVYLLYKFGLQFCKNKRLVAVSIGLFAFLFSHFDVVLWAHHMYIIIGFCMFLLGFMGYLRFLRTGNSLLLPVLILCFMLGVWCYEAFLLWPFAIIILSRLNDFKDNKIVPPRKIFKANLLIWCSLYTACLLFYFFTRTLNTYESASHALSDFFKFGNFTMAGFLALFNMLYNNIIINIVPFFSFPLTIRENIYMGGPLLGYIDKGHLAPIYWGAGIFLILLSVIFIFLFRKKRLDEIKIIVFFFYLTLSLLYILFFCRLVTNNLTYGFTEFRYQYVPNAFMALALIVLFDRLLKGTIWKKRLIYLLVAAVFAFNIYCVRKITCISNQQLADLGKILSNIKSGIKSGCISVGSKLYINDEITDYLPNLCWNIEMGNKFMKGNYQWLFSRREVETFTDKPENADWVINMNDFSVIKKSQVNNPISRKTINEGKDEQYVDVGNYFKDHGEYVRANTLFQRALRLNPAYSNAYRSLGYLYNVEGRFQEAEVMFKKAIALDPANPDAYNGLGSCYKNLKKYPEAEAMLIKMRELDPTNSEVYINLGHLYNQEARFQDAQTMFKKSIELRSTNYSAYHGLGVCYKNMKKYREAEAVLKKAIEMGPFNTAVYADLAYLYNEEGRFKEAEELFKRVKK